MNATKQREHRHTRPRWHTAPSRGSLVLAAAVLLALAHRAPLWAGDETPVARPGGLAVGTPGAGVTADPRLRLAEVAAVPAAGHPLAASELGGLRQRPAQAGCREMLANGGFEEGPEVGWSLASNLVHSNTGQPVGVADVILNNDRFPSSDPAYEGEWLAFMPGVTDGEVLLYQSTPLVVDDPSRVESATLTFALGVVTDQFNNGVADDTIAAVLVRTTPSGVRATRFAVPLSEEDTERGRWQRWQVTLDSDFWSEVSGDVHNLGFFADNSAADVTAFFLDDVSLQVCERSVAATPSRPAATATRPRATATPARDGVTPGRWYGSGASGLSLAFTIDSSGTEVCYFGATWPGRGGARCSTTIDWRYCEALPGDGSLDFADGRWVGRFTSASRAEGTWSSVGQADCAVASGPWSASAEAAPVTATATRVALGRAYLPIVRRDPRPTFTPTPTATATMTPTPTATPSPVPVGIVLQGTTNQGREFRIEISPDRARVLGLSYRFAVSCGGFSGEGTTSLDTSESVVNGVASRRFHIWSLTMPWDVQGEFDASFSRASGTWRDALGSCSASGTWNASR